MWNWSGSDLKLRLTLRVAAVSMLCFAAISGYFLIEADRSVRARIAAVADVAARTLELQQSKIQWLNNPRSDFPDLDSVAASVMAPGLCLAFRSNSGEISQRFCGGTQTDTAVPPQAFAALYRRLFDPGRETVRPVIARGQAIGEAVVWVDPAVLTTEAWHDAGRLMAVLMLALPLLCALVYAALSRALRPTRLIRDGLERIAAGDLAARLPPFDLAELSAIGDVFNDLAERLATALSDRNALTQKLIVVQDEERRHLARELHDEFGQSLAAIRALAASARLTAVQDCPPLLAECDGIARTATDMMETLRGALFRLRPPDVDELGLASSLEGLIAGWNGRSRGQPRFEIAISGSFERIPASTGANLYRIVQEALTNAAKHAGATRVMLRLEMRETASAGGGSEIVLAIDDDGRPGDPPVKSGMGLLGMRERVAALGGRLSFEAGQSNGASLRVSVPVAAGPEAAFVERAA
ncbi:MULTISPECIES: sensor histidine kinase [unclassified Bradyrhizobium]|uniref:sensor histidine kinase n=1 Tax=unclassified Bradyrhizobium TaxID=2631580 RepID=UPI001BA774F0|nr:MULTISPECIES: histidine kinase [unclassified Bradyrhizobium]MBR1207059.1 HAMP domain-containing protein [Bradyrhizobium sp. AUGA SZCCT0124]MBR1313598.1 HAMP domain-containing protein [Bradyrhizobium sp. AUGA SZCCT0051]MBR1343305.1 HAMP domain-containing protein [Bradyrhizobium sp. AUGA SZCCT0105]MBR1357275.1 HAMP domain-containing protein [Bradyrhizobium sp. AUGA SZCCT0045]